MDLQKVSYQNQNLISNFFSLLAYMTVLNCEKEHLYDFYFQKRVWYRVTIGGMERVVKAIQMVGGDFCLYSYSLPHSCKIYSNGWKRFMLVLILTP